MELSEALKMIQDNLNNQEVKDFTKQFNPLEKLSKDSVGEFIEGNEILKSYRDSYFSKGLETWKTNNLKKLLDEEIKKINPPETPEQKKIRELEERLNETETKAKKEALRNIALSKLTEKKMPTDLVDYLIGTDEETTNSRLQTYEELLSKYKKDVVSEVLKTNGRTPPEGKTELSTNNPWKKDNWNLTNQMKLIKNNPDLAKSLAKEAGHDI